MENGALRIKSSRSRKSNKLVLFRIAWLILAVFLIFSMIGLQAELSEANKKYQAEKKLESDIDWENKNLKNILDNASEKELIEKAAREKLDYAYPLEIIFINKSGK